MARRAALTQSASKRQRAGVGPHAQSIKDAQTAQTSLCPCCTRHPRRLPQRRRRPQPPPRFDGQRALDHTRNVVALGPRPAGSPALAKTRDYIRKELSALGRDRQGAGLRRRPRRPARCAMVNLRAMIGGAGHRQAADRRRPLRHQAVQGRHVRRRERRRIEHRLPDRAGAGPEAVAARDARRAAVSRRRGGRAPRVASIRTTATAAAITSRARRKDGTLPADRRAGAGRHDRRHRSRHEAGIAVDAVADRHHLGHRRAARAPGVRRRRDADRGRSHSVSRGGRPGGRSDRSRLPGVAHPATTRWTS